MEQTPKAIISAILTRKQNGVMEVFLQTRWKLHVSPTYSGLLEIPAGGIDAYENIYDVLRREVKEECGSERSALGFRRRIRCSPSGQTGAVFPIAVTCAAIFFGVRKREFYVRVAILEVS
jgi:8-oxo-dGTP pyrophosphatase MutT (NUDIX family)